MKFPTHGSNPISSPTSTQESTDPPKPIYKDTSARPVGKTTSSHHSSQKKKKLSVHQTSYSYSLQNRNRSLNQMIPMLISTRMTSKSSKSPKNSPLNANLLGAICISVALFPQTSKSNRSILLRSTVIRRSRTSSWRCRRGRWKVRTDSRGRWII